MLTTTPPITRTFLHDLTAIEAPWWVSVLLPTHRTRPENRQDPIRLKNLVSKAESLLVERGVRGAEARRIVQPMMSLVDETLFWSRQEKGLAFYVWPEGLHELRIDSDVAEKVVVNDVPWILPLLPLASEDARFYILAFSAGSVRLFEAARHTIAARDLPGAPRDLEDMLRVFDEEQQLQFHTRAAPAGNRGERAAMFHGQGGGAPQDDRKVRLQEYCQQIDRALQHVLAEEHAPLVLGRRYVAPGDFSWRLFLWTPARRACQRQPRRCTTGRASRAGMAACPPAAGAGAPRPQRLLTVRRSNGTWGPIGWRIFFNPDWRDASIRSWCVRTPSNGEPLRPTAEVRNCRGSRRATITS